jgi:hypothetical protein
MYLSNEHFIDIGFNIYLPHLIDKIRKEKNVNN